jgi:hypothetical protein
MAKKNDTTGFGIAGFVVSIVSLFLGPFAIISGLIALILCIVQLKKNENTYYLQHTNCVRCNHIIQNTKEKCRRH